MALPTIPNWASDANYPNDAGPDANTPTKVTPSAGAAAMGVRRDSPFLAQMFNWLANGLRTAVAAIYAQLNGTDVANTVTINARLDIGSSSSQLIGNGQLSDRSTSGGFVGKLPLTGVDGDHTYGVQDADVFLIPLQTANHSWTISDTFTAAGKTLRFVFVGGGSNTVALKRGNGTTIVTLGNNTGNKGWADINTNGGLNDWTMVAWYTYP